LSRTRVRRIVVDGVVYRWRIRDVDPHWIVARIWRDGERVHFADVRLPFDDPWLSLPEAARPPERIEPPARAPAAPGRIAELIRAWVRQAGDADRPDGPTRNGRSG